MNRYVSTLNANREYLKFVVDVIFNWVPMECFSFNILTAVLRICEVDVCFFASLQFELFAEKKKVDI